MSVYVLISSFLSDKLPKTVPIHLTNDILFIVLQ